MKETGMKYDSDKPMMDLIPPAAEMALARVLTFGANKYAPNSWQTVKDGERRYMAAAMRHINAHRGGEMFDDESGELHLSHALTCLAFLVELTERHVALGDSGWTAAAIEAADRKSVV